MINLFKDYFKNEINIVEIADEKMLILPKDNENNYGKGLVVEFDENEDGGIGAEIGVEYINLNKKIYTSHGSNCSWSNGFENVIEDVEEYLKLIRDTLKAINPEDVVEMAYTLREYFCDYREDKKKERKKYLRRMASVVLNSYVHSLIENENDCAINYLVNEGILSRYDNQYTEYALGII